MAVYKLDPLTDPRWPRFLAKQVDVSIFHTVGWLEALRKTYRYEPVVYTSSSPSDELSDGIPFCRVDSWLTGRRLVSLPFSDHCQPLVEGLDALEFLLAAAQADASKEKCKFVEIRPLTRPPKITAKEGSFGNSASFHFHRVDLSLSLDDIHDRCHKKTIQSRIKRSEREELVYEEGNSKDLLDQFYSLLLITRRKHQVPPQPRSWFSNILDCLGDHILIRVASKDARPVASIITGAYGQSHYYKYGCSDYDYSSLGGTPMLLWRAISDAKAQGARWFDMGRSDMTNLGLVKFKDRWGAECTSLNYYRTPPPPNSAQEEGWKERMAKGIFSRLPDRLLIATGGMLYRHLG